MLPGGLYALIDDGLRPELSLEHKAQGALEGGARVLQLRLKRTPEREAIAACRKVAALCREGSAVFLINDRVDWALLCGAHGVHLGAEDLPVGDARKLLGPEALIGATVRGLAGAIEAHQAGASYVGLGPIFHSGTKKVDAPLLGVQGLAQVSAASPLPVVAISGITLENIDQVASAGAHGAAVASDLLLGEPISLRARQLGEAFARGKRSPARLASRTK